MIVYGVINHYDELGGDGGGGYISIRSVLMEKITAVLDLRGS